MRKILEKYKGLEIPAKATIWFTISNILQKGILFLAVPIYTRLMTTSEYGIYSVFLSWLEIFEIFATFRLGWGGYVVGLTKYENEREKYTSSLQCLSILITFTAMIFYLIFSDYINAFTELDSTLTLMAFSILFSMPAIQFWSVRNRVEYKYKKVLVVTLISSALTILFGVLFAKIYMEKTKAVIFARVLVQGIEGIILIWLNCRKNFTFFHKEYWKRTFRVNIPLLPYYLSLIVLHSSDRIFIKNLVGNSQAGIYGVAYSVSTCMQLFNSSLTQTLQPWLYFKIKKNEVEKVPQIINFTLVLVAGLNLFFIAIAPEIISIIAPVEYQEAVWIIPPLSASVVIMYFYQHFVNVEFYFEESKLIAIASIGAAGLNMILNYIFIPIYGYQAAGYTTLISYIIFAIVHYYFMIGVCRKRNYKKKLVQIEVMLLILGGFFILGFLLMLGYKNIKVRLCVISIICVIFWKQRKECFDMLKNIGK